MRSEGVGHECTFYFTQPLHYPADQPLEVPRAPLLGLGISLGLSLGRSTRRVEPLVIPKVGAAAADDVHSISVPVGTHAEHEAQLSGDAPRPLRGALDLTRSHVLDPDPDIHPVFSDKQAPPSRNGPRNSDGEEELLYDATAGEYMPRLRILIVDDSALNRKLMAKRLRKEGHECCEAEDGDAAVDLVAQSLRVDDGVDESNTTPGYDAITMDNVLHIVYTVTHRAVPEMTLLSVDDASSAGYAGHGADTRAWVRRHHRRGDWERARRRRPGLPQLRREPRHCQALRLRQVPKGVCEAPVRVTTEYGAAYLKFASTITDTD